MVVMTDEATPATIPGDAPTAVELLIAVHAGDLDLIKRLLRENPDVARARFEARGGTSTALHFVTDWPGYFANGPDIVHLLVDAGADPNALTTGDGSDTPGPGSETPLHYAASSDDVDVAAALIDRGADLETPDGAVQLNACCLPALISIGNHRMLRAPHWMPLAVSAPDRTM